MDKHFILQTLKELKPVYEQEGFIIEGLFGSYASDQASEESDVDILMHTDARFTEKYGMLSFKRLNEIREELSQYFHTKVDIASSSGMGKTAKKFIIDKAIYI